MAFKLIGVFSYLLVLLVIGALASRKMNDLRDYFVGGKSMSFWVVAFSSRATGESAWLLLGLTGMGATLGVNAFWVVIGETLGVSAAWLLMSRRFKILTDEYDSVTIPDFLESHFKDKTQMLRKVAAATLVVFVTIYVSAQIDATGTAFETFLGWNYYVGALVGFAVVLVYIVSGGFVAVAWSDTFQGALMLAGLVSLPLIGWLSIDGGASAIASGLAAQDPALLNFSLGDNALAIFTTLSLGLIGLGFLGSPQIFVRFMSIRSTKEIGRGAAVAIIFTIFTDAGAVLAGMVGRYLLVDSGQVATTVLGKGGQDVLPLLVDKLIPLALAGIFIAIVLSAIMSTIDSLLVVASSAVVRDFYQKVKKPNISDEALVALSRKVTFALAIAALVISMAVALAVPERTVFWFVIFGWSGISATFCPVMILSLFYKGYTKQGAITSMIAGFLGVPFFKFVAPKFGAAGPYFEALAELPPSFLVAIVLGIIVSIATQKSKT